MMGKINRWNRLASTFFICTTIGLAAGEAKAQSALSDSSALVQQNAAIPGFVVLEPSDPAAPAKTAPTAQPTPRTLTHAAVRTAFDRWIYEGNLADALLVPQKRALLVIDSGADVDPFSTSWINGLLAGATRTDFFIDFRNPPTAVASQREILLRSGLLSGAQHVIMRDGDPILLASALNAAPSLHVSLATSTFPQRPESAKMQFMPTVDELAERVSTVMKAFPQGGRMWCFVDRELPISARYCEAVTTAFDRRGADARVEVFLALEMARAGGKTASEQWQEQVLQALQSGAPPDLFPDLVLTWQPTAIDAFLAVAEGEAIKPVLDAAGWPVVLAMFPSTQATQAVKEGRVLVYDHYPFTVGFFAPILVHLEETYRFRMQDGVVTPVLRGASNSRWFLARLGILR